MQLRSYELEKATGVSYGHGAGLYCLLPGFVFLIDVSGLNIGKLLLLDLIDISFDEKLGFEVFATQ